MKTDKSGADSQLSTLNHQLAGNGEVKESKPADYAMPNSCRVYVAGNLHPDIRVPFREISLAPTKTMSGEIEVNEPVRVYDTSGPWGDAGFNGDVEQGLPPLRSKWIRDRSDVEEIDGRKVTPIDDGYLSETHAAHAVRKRSTLNAQRSTSNGSSNGDLSTLNSQPSTRRKPLRGRGDHPVTQLWYARQGIITPEMEFIAIRENCNAEVRGLKSEVRNDLGFTHAGSEPISNHKSAVSN